MATTRLAQALRIEGLKLTRSRLAVLRVLSDASEHLKVAEVHRRARHLEPRIGLASVYRTMGLLARLRLVTHIHMDHRHRHYTSITEGHCHHLVCRTCGRVVEFSDCGVENLSRLLSRRTRFRIEGHYMDFFGECPGCRRGARIGKTSRRAPANRRSR
jgi:Fur family transcriptional regulator, ferric uptake regulator